MAISIILQSDKTEAELTELLSAISTDIRTDGTLDSSSTKVTLLAAVEILKFQLRTIRSNIEKRYSDLGMSGSISAFEPYALKLTTSSDTTAPTNSTITINSGNTTTNSRTVTLALSSSDLGFYAKDPNTGVTGYYLSESPTAPSASASVWIAVTSTQIYSENVSFTFSEEVERNRTVYAWFKDAAGNVSSSTSDSIRMASTGSVLASADADGMVLLSGGTFTMGDIQGGGYTDESPTHSVTLSSFYISEDEITAQEYVTCVTAGSCTAQGSGANSTLGDTTGKAVNYVSWNDFTSYISWKNANSTRTFRMCTEAEWEYAARAGTDTKWACGNTESCFTATTPPMAWYATNSGTAVHVTKTTTANAWGLYDMHGNVWEWVSDWYGSYSSAPVTNPTGATSGSRRVNRGGDFNGPLEHIRSALRSSVSPSIRFSSFGARLCAVP